MSEAGSGYIHTLTKWLELLVRTEKTCVAYKMLNGNSEGKCRRCLVLIETEFISIRSLKYVIQTVRNSIVYLAKEILLRKQADVTVMQSLFLAILNHGFQPSRVT